MAVGVSAIFMFTALCGGKYETAVFDGPRPHENVPVCFAGLLGECGRDRQHGCPGFGECAIERGKAQVVANGKTQAAPREICQHRQFAGAVVARLAITLAACKVDVEHMNLVVAREDVTLRVDQERTVGSAVCLNLDREPTDMDVDPELAGNLAQGCKRCFC